MSRGIETSVETSVEEKRRRQMKLSRDNSTKAKKKLNRSTNCRETIEGPGTFSIDPLAVETTNEIAIRNSLRSRQIGQVSKGVEEVLRLLKNSVSRREKHKYECNQACNSTNDPINILNSQKHFLTTIFKHMDPKNTHTHTKQI